MQKIIMHVGKYILLRAVFSSMRNIKTAERNGLTGRLLANILRIKNASFDANIEIIVAGRQSQKSQ